MDAAPIGIFDSGLGGLTVARSVMDKLPNERIIYIGDTANTPYGPKPIALVRELALNVMDEMATRGVKMIVIACNTASAAVLRDARERYEVDAGIPVIEVIQPAARRAVAATSNRRIGVIGTEATVLSRAYLDAFAAVPDLTVIQQACPRFVDFVEAGVTTGQQLYDVATQYLRPLKEADIDTLVLGCTHYPLLTGVISHVMDEQVTLVSSAESTANDVYAKLVDADSLRSDSAGAPEHEFYGTGPVDEFGMLARRFLGPVVGKVQHVEV